MNGQQVGSVNTSVMLFDDAPTTGDFGIALADWVVQTNSATAGTSFQITRPGTYQASLSALSLGNENSLSIGITLDATGTDLTNPPLIPIGSVQAAASAQDASLPNTLFCSAPIYVTQEMIDLGLGIIRAQGSPDADMNSNFIGFVLRRTGPVSLPS